MLVALSMEQKSVVKLRELKSVMAAPSHAATEATPHGIWSLAVGIGVAAVRGQEEGGVLGHAREVEIEGQDLGARNVAAVMITLTSIC
jgi:hypothetical protein